MYWFKKKKKCLLTYTYQKSAQIINVQLNEFSQTEQTGVTCAQTKKAIWKVLRLPPPDIISHQG